MKRGYWYPYAKSKLQQLLIASNIYTTIITRIYLAKIRHIINRLVDDLKSIYDTIYNDNLALDSLSYAETSFDSSRDWQQTKTTIQLIT